MKITTVEQLKGFLEDWLQENVGATPEEMKDAVAKWSAASDQQIREEGQQARETAVQARTAGAWDPTDRSHPYVQRAGHIIRTDAVKVQRAGGRRDAFGNSAASYESKGAGFRLARLIRAYRCATLENSDVDSILKGWGDDWMLDDLGQERDARSLGHTKALGYSSLASGGALVPTAYVQEMIELLRARNVIRSAGARQLPLPNGNLTMPRQTGAATASYTGESSSLAASQGTLDQITLVAKKLMAITAVSNELMRTADPSADRFVRDDLLATAANREDLAFIRGDGTQNTPRGLRYAAASISAAAAGATLGDMLTTTQDLFTQLANSNIAMERPAFFLSPRSYYALMFARDASGDGLLLREEIANGSLFGVPIFTTTQIPVNLGGGSDSEMYLADMNQVIIGVALNPVVAIFDGAAYNSGGAVVSGVSRDETVVRMKQEHDIVVRHPEAVAVKTGVQF